MKNSNQLSYMTIVVFILAFFLIPFGYADALSDFTFTISNIQYTSTITTNGANVTYVVTAQNNGINVSDISCDSISGSLFPVGDTPVICTATDNQGSTSTTSFIITVEGTDSTPPIIVPPADVSTVSTGQYTTVNLGTPTVSDNADPSPIFANNAPEIGFPIGITIVTWTAFDHSGNTATAPQKITVIDPTDTTPPTTFASPVGGSYSSLQLVTLTSNESAAIYYTTDDSTPTTSSTLYYNPISINVGTTTLKFIGVDSNGNVESSHNTEVYTIITYPIIHMQDTTASGGYSTFSGRPIHAEYVSSSSQLVGDKIDTITLRLGKTGAPTGFAQIGVLNTDLSVKKLFGTKDVSTISTSYTDYTFALGPTDLYTIQSGDRIGIKYTGGSANTHVKTMSDGNTADPFDGTNTYRVEYKKSWSSSTAQDLYMTLTQTHP